MAFYEKREDISSYGMRFSVGEMVDYSYGAHWHNEIEVTLVLEGMSKIGINARSQLLSAGEMAFCPSGSIHYIESVGPSRVIILIFHPDILHNILPGIHFGTEFIKQDSLKNQKSLSIMNEYIKCIYQEMTNQQAGYRAMGKGYLAILLTLLMRECPIPPKSSNEDSHAIFLVQSAVSFIEENYTEEITLDGLAKQLCVSVSHLSRIFSRTTGYSFKQFLNDIRVQKARELIMSSNKQMIDIAFECGFNSMRTFNRVFKEATDCNPTEYRNQAMNNPDCK